MALIVTDVGADNMLKAYFNNDWPTGGNNHTLHLYTNNYTPVDTSANANFTEAAGGGYAAKTLAHGNWTVTAGNDPSDAAYAQQTFTFTGNLTGNASVYGYHVKDEDDAVIWAEKFASPFTPANNGDNIKITPLVQASKGTPA
jgi:hypothetical protein